MSDSNRRTAPIASTAGQTVPLDRRRFLARTAAALAAAPLGKAIHAHAAAAPYVFAHGAFEITVLSDGHFVLPPPGSSADVGFLYPDTPRPELEAFLRAAGLGIERVQLPNNVVLIRAASDLVLVDTGAGSGWQPTAGKLVENLQAADVDTSAVTQRVVSHLRL